MLMSTQQGQSQGHLQRPQALDILQPPQEPLLMHHHNSHPHYQTFPNHHQQPPPTEVPPQPQQHQQQHQHQQQYPHSHQTQHEDLHYKEQLQLQPHQYQQPQQQQQQQPLPLSSWPRQQRQRPTNTTERLQQQSPSLSPSHSHSQPQRVPHSQQQGPPLSLSMSFEHISHRQEVQKDASQPRRNRIFSWSASTTPLTPLSAGVTSLPTLGAGDFGHPVYMDPQQYHQLLQQQQQHYQQSHHQCKQQGHSQHQLISATSHQSMTPDHFLGNDFDWITVGDLDTQASSRTGHLRTVTDSGVTPPLTSASTSTSGQSSSTSTSSPYELYALTTAASSLPTTAIADLEMLSLQTESSPPTHSKFGQEPVMSAGTVLKTQGIFGSDNSKPERRRRSKAQKDPSVTTIAYMSIQSTVRSFNSDAKNTAGSTPHSNHSTTPSMPSPLSPMLTFPDGRVLQHSLQKGNPNLKQEPMEHTSNAPSTALSTPASTSESTPNSSSILYDIFPMSSSPQSEVVFSQHHRVLSTTSQDSRGGGGGSTGGWGGHCNTSLPSSISKYAPHHALGGNACGTSLSGQSVPRREALHKEIDISPVHTNRDTKAIGGSSTNMSPDPNESTFKAEVKLNIGDSVAQDKDGVEGDSDSENGRPAVCPHCNKEFQSKGLLRSHVVSHSSDRPFVCWDCNDKSYKRNHDLLRHRREKHNADGATVPSRGSNRHQSNSGGTVREAVHERATQQVTTVGQSHFPHHEMMYPSHGMMYLGSGGLSDLSSPSSSSPLDPYAGVDYSQHHHGHSHYTSHGHNVGLGLGLEMGIYGSKDFLGGLGILATSVGGEGRSPGSGRRPSRVGGVNPPPPTEETTGKRRKLSNSGLTTSKA